MNGAVLAKVLECSSAVEIEFFGQPRSEFSRCAFGAIPGVSGKSTTGPELLLTLLLVFR